MTLKDQIIVDQQTFMNDWSELFTVKLDDVTVKEISGIFDQSVEVLSPYDSEVTVIRPAVSFSDDDFSGFDKTHSFTRNATGAVYKIFGDPRPDGCGLTLVYLVKA